MKNSSLTLYLEINNLKFAFFVVNIDENNNLKIIYEQDVPLMGIEKNRISDLEKAFEEKLNKKTKRDKNRHFSNEKLK